MLVLVLGHQFQKPGPLVFYPHGVEILEVRAKHQHNLGGVQRGEDVWLVLRSQFILQGDTREERPVAFFGQGIIHILGDNTVDGTTPAFVCLFVADEDVVGFLFAGDFQYTFADILNGLGLVPVEPSGDGVSVLAGLPQTVRPSEQGEFFSLSWLGMVCLLPQYSHSATLAPSAKFRSPPHILHLITAMVSSPPICFFLHNFHMIHRKFQTSHHQLCPCIPGGYRDSVQLLHHVTGHPHRNNC